MRDCRWLEDANIQLGSVATDILDVSGRGILERLVPGEQDVGKLAERARGQLRRQDRETVAGAAGP